MKLNKLFLYALFFVTLCSCQPTSDTGDNPSSGIRSGFEDRLNDLFSVTPSLKTDIALEYFIETSGHFTREEAHSLPDHKWNTTTTALFLGDEARPVWVKFTLNLTPSSPRIINIDWPLISDLQLHVFNKATNNWIQSENNSYWNINNSASKFPYFIFLNAPNHADLEVFLRVTTDRVFSLPINLFSEKEFRALETKRNLLTGLFFGVILGLLAYNFSLFIFIRDKIYAVYCCYAASIILYTLTTTGVGRAYIWNDHPDFNNFAYPLTSSLSFVSACFFIRYFLDLKKWGNNLILINNVAILCWSIVAISSLIPNLKINQTVFDLIAITSTLVGIVMTFYLYKKGSIAAKYLMIAWTPLMVATLYLMFNFTGLLARIFHESIYENG